MGFGGTGGGGSSSIATSTDVALSGVANNEVLTYDGTVAKWRNATNQGVPNGGTTNQVLAKQSGTAYDMEWADSARLSNDLPLPSGNATAGTLSAASRADHVHPVNAGVGYPASPGDYTCPVGISTTSTTTLINDGWIRVSPLPVFKTLKVAAIVPALSNNTGTKNIQIAIYAADPTAWKPAARVGNVLSVTTNNNSFTSEPTYSPTLQLTPGMYWVAVLCVGSQLRCSVCNPESPATSYHTSPTATGGVVAYSYQGGAFSSLPSTLAGQTLTTVNETALFYSLKPAAL